MEEMEKNASQPSLGPGPCLAMHVRDISQFQGSRSAVALLESFKRYRMRSPLNAGATERAGKFEMSVVILVSRISICVQGKTT
jgi:hypothetical protein